MKKTTFVILFLVFAAAVCIVCSCSVPLAGGTSDSGNARIAAIIYKAGGGRAAGAQVTVCDKNYTNDLYSDSIRLKGLFLCKTVTDDTGYFAIDSIDNGDYSIEVNDAVSNAVLLKATLSAGGDSMVAFNDTLRPYAEIDGSIGPLFHSPVHRYVLVYGLDRRVPVDSSGQFTISDLPAGTFRFRIVADDASISPADLDSVAVSSGKVDSLPFMGWKHRTQIILNTTVSGAAVSGNVYNFPVMVRLTNTNFDFKEAASGGSDCIFTKPDDSPLAFEIERWDAALGIAEIWVKIDTISGNNTTQCIYLYWGNTVSMPPSKTQAVFDTNVGFQGVWHLSDAAVDSVKDATSNHFNGIASGMTAGSVVDGMVGKARFFDGVSTSIVIPNSADGKLNFPQDGSYSLSAWVYSDTIDDKSHVVISKGDEQYFLCSVYKPVNSSLWNFDEFKDVTGWQSVAWPVSSKEWTYIVGVRNGTGQALYVNGELVDTTMDLTRSTKSRVLSFDVAIGKFMESYPNEDAKWFHGAIDEVRMHSASLSAEWVRLCFMNQRADDKLLIFK